MKESLFEITCISRQKLNWIHQGIKLIIGDLLEEETISQIPNQDIVIHIAGVTHAKYYNEYYKGNVETTINLVKYFDKLNIKHFIFLSTRCAVKNSGSYGLTKLESEKIIINSGLPFTILRLSEVLGYNLSSYNFLKSMAIFFPFVFIPNTNKINLNPILETDLIDILIKIIFSEKSTQKIYTISGDENFSLKEIMNIVPGLMKGKRIFISLPIIIFKIIAYCNLILKKPYFFPDQIDRLICKKSSNISMIKNDFNFFPRSVKRFLNNM